jgi:hypothetical protein
MVRAIHVSRFCGLNDPNRRSGIVGVLVIVELRGQNLRVKKVGKRLDN